MDESDNKLLMGLNPESKDNKREQGQKDCVEADVHNSTVLLGMDKAVLELNELKAQKNVLLRDISSKEEKIRKLNLVKLYRTKVGVLELECMHVSLSHVAAGPFPVGILSGIVGLNSEVFNNYEICSIHPV